MAFANVSACTITILSRFRTPPHNYSGPKFSIFHYSCIPLPLYFQIILVGASVIFPLFMLLPRYLYCLIMGMSCGWIDTTYVLVSSLKIISPHYSALHLRPRFVTGLPHILLASVWISCIVRWYHYLVRIDQSGDFLLHHLSITHSNRPPPSREMVALYSHHRPLLLSE